MLMPDLPQPWLARTLRKKFPELCAWTEELSKTVFGLPVTVKDAFLKNPSLDDTRENRPRGQGPLPWKVPYNGGIIGVGGVFLSSMADSIPIVGQLRRNIRMRQHGGKTPDDDVQSPSWQSITAVGSMIAGVGLVIGYMFNQGLLSLTLTEEVEKDKRTVGLGALGEAGAALSVYANEMDAEVQRQKLQEASYTHGVSVAEVDIEVGKDSDRSIESSH
jgi:sorting and assembly machinery component 37